MSDENKDFVFRGHSMGFIDWTDHRKTIQSTSKKKTATNASKKSKSISQSNLKKKPTSRKKKPKKTLSEYIKTAEEKQTASTNSMKLSRVFHIPYAGFKQFKLRECGFSTSLIKLLNNYDCFTLSDLLALTINDLRAKPRITENVLLEIFGLLNDYALKHKYIRTRLDIAEAEIDIEKVYLVITTALTQQSRKMDSLNYAEKQRVEKYLYSADLLGIGLSLQALRNPQYMKTVIEGFSYCDQAFSIFRRRQTSLKLLDEIKENTPVERLNYYIQAYSVKKNDALLFIPNVYTWDDLKSLIQITDYDEAVRLRVIEDFLLWLDFDIQDIADRIFAVVEQDDRYVSVLRERAYNNRSYREIGELLGVTTERVRQMEIKAIRKLKHAYAQIPQDLIAVICAEVSNNVLYFDDIVSFIGKKRTQMLWYLLSNDKMYQNKPYRYAIGFDAILFNVDVHAADFFIIIRDLPNIIPASEVDAILEKQSKQHNIPYKLFKTEFYKQYVVRSEVCYDSETPSKEIYDYLLCHYFPTGYKISSNDTDCMRYFVEEVFDIHNNIDNRAIDNAVYKVGILIDRGKYIHPAHINVDGEIIDLIRKYIAESVIDRIMYLDMYNDMKDLLSGTQITNRYALKGIFEYYDGSYKTDRDYIYKKYIG